jgi:anti-sigma B factor antagonist
MAVAEGTVKVHRQGPTLIVQVVGWGRMQQSLPLRRFFETCMKEGATGVRVDLRHCTYLDSTFLGTLLFLRRQLQQKCCGNLVLVSPSAECCQLLHQIGVAELFMRDQCDEDECGWQDLCGDRSDAHAFNRTVVEAHQELANLGGSAGAAFQAVAKGLTEDWEKQQRQADRSSL